MRKTLSALLFVAVVVALAAGLKAGAANDDDQQCQFVPGTLILSRSVYAGNPSSVVIGQTLPPNCVPGTITLPLLAGGTTTVTIPAASSSGCNTAVTDGTYPTVFNNDKADGSFGIPSPILLDNITTAGRVIGTLPVPTDLLVTSFSSKSELAVHRSLDG